jgi:drug/metabolite transporter (DMT)-like permease
MAAPNIAAVPAPRRTIIVLIIAVAASAWAAPLIRLASAPANAIAAWRVTIATLLLAPIFFGSGARREWSALTPRDRWIGVAAGAALAVHFATWIASVRLTSIAASSILVALSPIFSGLLSWWFLREPPTGRQVAGIGAAILGASLIALGDSRNASSSALLGDALALTGAVCGAVYFVIGRHLRGRLGLVAYVTPVYGASAVLLLLWAASQGQAIGPFATRDWLIFAALAAGPTLIGHSGLNYSLRYLPAFAVGVAALGEPIGSTIIAWLLPSIAEPPPPAAIAGGIACLAGIAWTLAAAPPRRAR